MQFGIKRPLNGLSMVCLSLGCATAAYAQELEQVVVTGTAVPTEYSKIGNSVTVVDGQQIEDGGYTYVPDVLRQAPGMAINRTGS